MKPSVALALALLAAGGSAGAIPATTPPALAETAAPSAAALETRTFAIENMTCALCPVTVRMAMEGVAGVQSVSVDFATKTATAVFDPSLTSPDAIAAAATRAGYPASVRG